MSIFNYDPPTIRDTVRDTDSVYRFKHKLFAACLKNASQEVLMKTTNQISDQIPLIRRFGYAVLMDIKISRR